jgi:hypothetical protein
VVGTPVLYVSTTDICRITLSLSRMLSAENSCERLRTITGMQQEAIAFDNSRERGRQRTRFAGEHERRHAAQLIDDLFDRAGVGPFRLLRARERRQLAGSQSKFGSTGRLVIRSRCGL